MSDGSRFRRAILLLALLSIGFSIVAVHGQNILPLPVSEFIQGLSQRNPQATLHLFGAAIAIIGLMSLWVWRARSHSEQLADRTPEEPDREESIAGSNHTSQFEQRRKESETEAIYDDEPLKNALRNVLIEIYDVETEDDEDAEKYVDQGHWTADRYAAAFITASPTVNYPLHFRLFAWLYPGDAYAYAARRAVRETEAFCEQRLPQYDAPNQTLGLWERLRSISFAGHSSGDQT